jgi:hypothetical protein
MKRWNKQQRGQESYQGAIDYKPQGKCAEFLLPHSALSWNFSLSENLANLSLQDGATKWHYNQSASQP